MVPFDTGYFDDLSDELTVRNPLMPTKYKCTTYRSGAGNTTHDGTFSVTKYPVFTYKIAGRNKIRIKEGFLL